MTSFVYETRINLRDLLMRKQIFSERRFVFFISALALSTEKLFKVSKLKKKELLNLLCFWFFSVSSPALRGSKIMQMIVLKTT